MVEEVVEVEEEVVGLWLTHRLTHAPSANAIEPSRYGMLTSSSTNSSALGTDAAEATRKSTDPATEPPRAKRALSTWDATPCLCYCRWRRTVKEAQPKDGRRTAAGRMGNAQSE